jgi:branched-chain amino acid transport system substrate-binding protein
MANYDFSKPDLTGIEISSYVFSKLSKGKFERLQFTTK